MIRVPDRAELVLIGAEALQADPDEVLDQANVAVLIALEGRLATTTTITEAAAEVLVSIAASQPFGRGNRATAWLAAAHIAAVNDTSFEIEPDDAVGLVTGAERGTLDERAVAAALAGHLPVRTGWLQHLTRAMKRALRPVELSPPPVPTCPLCQRTLDRAQLWLTSPWLPVTHDQAVSSCLRQHRAHRRDGTPLTDEASAPRRSCLVVLGPAGEGPPAFLALTDHAPVAFRPTATPTATPAYELIPLDTLSASDLVGSWDRLWAGREPVARVTVPTGHIGSRDVALDWPEVLAVLA